LIPGGASLLVGMMGCDKADIFVANKIYKEYEAAGIYNCGDEFTLMIAKELKNILAAAKD